MRPIEIVTLEGSFSYDALSPDGSTLYLIEHINRNDVAEYQVRAYDLAERRLLPYVIRDHRSNQVEMYGYPVSRATSADGRWAYTLYQSRHHSFVHALDTVARKAVCIDLPRDTPPQHVSDARLALGPGGEDLTVDPKMGGILAKIDTTELSLRPLGTDVPAATPADQETPWLLVALAVAVAILAAVFAVWRVRRLCAFRPDGRGAHIGRAPATTQETSRSFSAPGSGRDAISLRASDRLGALTVTRDNGVRTTRARRRERRPARELARPRT